MERKTTERLKEPAVFWFQFPKDDLEREAERAGGRFQRYLRKIGGGDS